MQAPEDHAQRTAQRCITPGVVFVMVCVHHAAHAALARQADDLAACGRGTAIHQPAIQDVCLDRIKRPAESRARHRHAGHRSIVAKL